MARTLIVAGLLAVLPTCTAGGQSTITYTLELGGDNHVADWENPSAIVNTPFTNGSAMPGRLFDNCHPITWNVVAACSGIHSSDGLAAQGIANVVFNLTLKDSGGNVVTTTQWFSTMNDGDMTGQRCSLANTPDPLEKAAWCLGWDVDMNEDGVLDGEGPPVSTGRIFDPVIAGGPFMDRVQFPSTSDFGGGRMTGGESTYVAVGPMSTMAPPGLLVGMGAGYSQFVYGQNSLGVGLDVGSVAPAWDPLKRIGIGARPLGEGQIDMYDRPLGTYTLVLTVPRDDHNNPMGQNIILGSYDPTAGPGPFAAEVDAVIENSIGFELTSCPDFWPVAPLEWRSCKVHDCGELCIPLDPTSTVGRVETRSGGLTKIKVLFDDTIAENVNYFPAAVAVSPALAVTPSIETTTVLNDTLVLSFSGSTDLKCHKIDLSAAISWKDAVCADEKDCLVRVQFGNVNEDCCTNLTDVAIIKAKNSSVPVIINPYGIKYDLNRDCLVNLSDMALAKMKNSSQTTTKCP